MTTRVASPDRPVAPDGPRRLHVTVATGDRVAYEGEADGIALPGVQGRFTVLVRHAAIVAALEPGPVAITTGTGRLRLAIGGGFADARDDQVIVLADTIELASEIDVARARAARQRALQVLETEQSGPEHEKARAALRRSEARLAVARGIRERPS